MNLPQYGCIYGYIFVYLGYKINNPKITNYESIFIRVSTDEQSELRQIQNVEGFDKVIIDKCSGLIPLWERPNIVKNKIKKLVDNGTIKHIEVHSIDRLGRDTLSVLSVWKELTEKGVRVVCRNPTSKT